MRRGVFSNWKLVALGLVTATVVAAGTEAALSLPLSKVPVAKAANCTSGPIIDDGVREWCGYFTNAFDDGTSPPRQNVVNAGVPGFINTAPELINWMQGMLTGPAGQDRTAAQFMILSMLGENGGNCAGCANRVDATNRFNEWARRVTAMDNENLIDWHFAEPWHCGVENSYYQSGGSNDDAWFHDSDDGCGPNATVDSIRFRSRVTNARIYAIRRFCANPIGALSALSSGDYNIDLTANFQGNIVDQTYAGPAFKVQSGQTYSLSGRVVNSGPASSDDGDLQADWVPQINQWCAAFCVPPAPEMTQLTGGHGGSYGFRATTVVTGGSGPTYHWNMTTPLGPNNGSTSGSFQFIPTAAPGTPFSITFWYMPADQNGTVVHVTVPFVIVSVRFPSVSGQNSDIHAGGAIGTTCPASTPTGAISGSGVGQSLGQYVLSASGGISSFGSNNHAAGSANSGDLNVGSSGSYYCVPRDDLYGAATLYRATGTGFSQRPGSAVPYDISGWSGLYYVDGNASFYTSTGLTDRVTIVSTAGNVNITGSIFINPAINTNNPRTEPSLGIIAANDINISAGVNLVEAYLFADGVIDTCIDGVGSPSACNGNTLFVNGFMMANRIDFRRNGPLNSSGNAVSEQVEMTPQLYLNPPQFFDSSIDALMLQGQGERPPLY